MGGTTNWDTFIFASETSDASRHLLQGRRQTRDCHRLRIHEAVHERRPTASTGRLLRLRHQRNQSTTFAGDGSDFASFLLGMGEAPGNGRRELHEDVFAAEASPYYAAFIQDNYHVTHTLTLNLGLRWDIFGSRTERHNRLEYFDPGRQVLIQRRQYDRRRSLHEQQQPHPLHHQPREPGTAPRLLLANQPAHGLPWRRQHLLRPQHRDGRNAYQDSDGFISSSAWNATNYNADGNTVYQHIRSAIHFPAASSCPTGSPIPLRRLGAHLSPSPPTAWPITWAFPWQRCCIRRARPRHTTTTSASSARFPTKWS